MPKKGCFKDKTGETTINNQGLKMWIKEYRGNRDIDVEFEDGFIQYHKYYSEFKKHTIINKNHKIIKNKPTSHRIGEINYNIYGSKMTIIYYENCDHITVKFENGFTTQTRYNHFKEGSIKSPYDKTVHGVGYIGECEIEKISYKYWSHMIERCFSDKYKKKNPRYKNTICCEEWLCYKNFKKWFNENYYTIDNERIHLDKDILCKNNNFYSPEKCVFVPIRINSLFTKANKLRGNLPIGVNDSRHNKYVASCAIACDNYKNSKDIHIGTYNTPLEAFDAYKIFKEKYIKEVADTYKDKIPQKLYDAMYKWKVEIDD